MGKFCASTSLISMTYLELHMSHESKIVKFWLSTSTFNVKNYVNLSKFTHWYISLQCVRWLNIVISHNLGHYYKAREGSLNERLTYMKALRHANNIDVNRYPGMRSNDVFLQMIDLDKGVYGQPFLVSLFLHNQAREERSIKITMITNSMYYTGHKVKKFVELFVLPIP